MTQGNRPIAHPFAEVAVNSQIIRGGATFHYAVSPSLPVEVGQLVLVPFGDAQMQGVVLDLVDETEVTSVKEIAGIVDSFPVLNVAQVALARWIASYYMAPIFEAVQLMLPPGLGQQLTPCYRLAGGAEMELTRLSQSEREVVEILAARGPMRHDQLRALTKARGLARMLARLVSSGAVHRELALRGPRVAPKLTTYLELSAAHAPGSLRGPMQRAVVDLLASRGAMAKSAVVKDTGCSSLTIETLMRRGLVAASHREVRRDPIAHVRPLVRPAPTLTVGQGEVWRQINEALDKPAAATFLLHGITGSGKTELYMRAIDHVLKQGANAIVLVPEISLTPQTVHRFAARFPGAIAVLHSKLTAGERFDEWRRVRAGDAAIVIGSRSAIFAPVPNLALIVVDEEHEWSYKQDKRPRYHARDVALKLGSLTGAKVILGSATPDVESFYRATSGRYRLLRLTERVLSGEPLCIERPEPSLAPTATDGAISADAREAPKPELPAVHIVDMRDELRAGNRSIFSGPLREAIREKLAKREQTILFLNRRGSASIVLCRDCGLVMRCRRCDFSLVFHGDLDELVCHQCNRHAAVPSQCPGCRSARIKFFGIGTQKVEEQARREFPGARVMRWDRDVTGGKLAHEELMRRFAGREADILVGTQMIAKGLDLPNVTLVGVIAADVALYLPDLRAGERTFQLLTQVAGRAGRGARIGQAIVQTYSPDNYCVQDASRHDYESFYRKEIEFRQQHGYPPFGRLIRLVGSHAGEVQAMRSGEQLAASLRTKISAQGIPGTSVFGPAPAFHRRVRGKYRWQLLLRGAYPDRLLEGMPLPLGWAIDVDPVSLL